MYKKVLERGFASLMRWKKYSSYADGLPQKYPNALTGFTLIELLVVIAIIGILASVVLASLNDARSRGADAAVVSSINNMRAQAELYYEDNGLSYANMCGDPNIQDAIGAAVNAGSDDTTCVDGTHVNGAWAIEAQLIASSTEYFCIDSSGASERVNGSSISNTSGSEDAVCG
jgi:prepilin-type N-terminal cleavage/methylation domain-containing protein